jgi:hypothetical protein
MQRVRLDARGTDAWGWCWGQPNRPLYHLTDGIDSCTIRAASPVEALAIIMVEAWPPHLVRRYNWEYS